MDIVYLFRHSKCCDSEIQFSLRSVAAYGAHIRKVWIFGDRPTFLTTDLGVAEHVPWESLAWLRHLKAPVRNYFLQCFLIAQHPEVSAEFLLFCDDYVLLNPLSEEIAKRDRYLHNLDDVKSRGAGLWKEALWRTYDLLKRMGYTGLNFETHTPRYLTKKRVFEAYRDFSDFVTEDRFAGMLGPTGILNHAYKFEQFELTRLAEEDLSVGFYNEPASYTDIVERTQGKQFLNFDDGAFSDDMRRFLAERFPDPCAYENDGANGAVLAKGQSLVGLPSRTKVVRERTPHQNLTLCQKKEADVGIGQTILTAHHLFSNLGIPHPVQMSFDWSANEVVAATDASFCSSIDPQQYASLETACRLLDVRCSSGASLNKKSHAPPSNGTGVVTQDCSNAISMQVEFVRPPRQFEPASTIENTAAYSQTQILREILPKLLAKLGVRSILEAPCGDYSWMRHVPLDGIRYIGVDDSEILVRQNTECFSSESVAFLQLDLLLNEVPAVDLILCRNHLMRLSFEQIRRVLKNFCQSGSQWLLTTTFPGRNSGADCVRGEWRPLNLEDAPISLPPPVALIIERCTEGGGRFADKSLGLWHLRDIQKAFVK